MTHTEIGSSVAITSAPVIDRSYDIAKQLASDLLQATSEDYIYFYNGSGSLGGGSAFDSFILIQAEKVYISEGSFQCDDCMVYQIFVTSETTTSDFDFSGVEIDLDSSPVSRFSGSGSFDSESVYYSMYYPYTRQHVTVTSHVDNVIYSSIEGMPKLVEGGQNYAHAAFCLAFIVIVFKLADRFFRRVY